MCFGWDESDLAVAAGLLEVAPRVATHPEYLLVGAQAEVGRRECALRQRYDGCEDKGHPLLTIRLRLRRRPWYYLLRLVFTLFMVTTMGSLSFLLPPEDLAIRLGLTGTVVLSAVGFQVVAAGSLPKVPYLTRFDVWILLMHMLIFASFLENMFSFFAHQTITNFASLSASEKVLLLSLLSPSERRSAKFEEGAPSRLRTMEQWLAVAYIGAVVVCTLWFVSPLRGYTWQNARVAAATRAAARIAATGGQKEE